MTDAKAHRIVADVHNRVRDQIVCAADIADSLDCGGSGKTYEQIEKLKTILHKIDCDLNRAFDGHCPCDRCSRPKRSEGPHQWWMQRIGMVHG